MTEIRMCWTSKERDFLCYMGVTWEWRGPEAFLNSRLFQVCIPKRGSDSAGLLGLRWNAAQHPAFPPLWRVLLVSQDPQDFGRDRRRCIPRASLCFCCLNLPGFWFCLFVLGFCLCTGNSLYLDTSSCCFQPALYHSAVTMSLLARVAAAASAFW